MGLSKILGHDKLTEAWDCVVTYDGGLQDSFHFWASGIRDAAEKVIKVMPIRDNKVGLKFEMTRRNAPKKEVK